MKTLNDTVKNVLIAVNKESDIKLDVAKNFYNIYNKTLL